MENLNIGPLSVCFNRTLIVKKGDTSSLPPSVGLFQIYKVSDFKNNCPKTWKEDGYFIGMHNNEAMWMNFQTMAPTAIMVGVGGINALNGEEFSPELKEENYVVSPPQPWIDGWKSAEKDTVYQFIATKFENGGGLSVAEQLISDGCECGAIEIVAFESKEKLEFHTSPDEIVVCGSNGFGRELCDAPEFCEMALGLGGKISQKIYPDPYGIDVWKSEPLDSATIYMVNEAQFAEITGKKMSEMPMKSENYEGPWFDLKDENMGDIKGSEKFDDLTTI